MEALEHILVRIEHKIERLIAGSDATPPPRFMRTGTAAEYMGVSKRTFEKWRLTGAGPPFSRIGGVPVYDRLDIDEFMRKRKCRSTSDDLSQ